MTQQNAALVEQASAAAQALTNQANELTDLTAHYDVGQSVGAAGSRAAPRSTTPAARPVTAARGTTAIRAAAGVPRSATPQSAAPRTTPPAIVAERRTSGRPWKAKPKSEPAAAQEAPRKAAQGGDDTWQEF
jgi:methyl-accepting chemotaxis protein